MKLWLLIFSTVALVACGSGSSSNSDPETDNNSNDNSGGDTIDYDSQGYFDSELFSSDLISEERVSCTLNNGTITTCYELTFNVNGVGSTAGDGMLGPFCPARADTVASESGFGFYDGPTNPGFQLLTTAAANMEIDGYDIIDENGDIKTDGGDGAACLHMNFDNSKTITYLVPVVTEEAAEPWEVTQIQSIGFGVYGVPYKGNPPGVIEREGRIPSLDHCGGHPDPAGYYHWHFIPQSMNLVLSSDGYDFRDENGGNIGCKNNYIVDASLGSPNPSAFAGLAKDGYPIYGALDWNGTENTEPTDLDDCNGHTHATQDFDDDVVYHYHAYREAAPNHPKCLMGLFVEDDWTLE